MLEKVKSWNQENIILNKKQFIMYCFLIFMLSAVFGWMYEEILCILKDHVIEKRGFLYGPYLPIYGWGSLLILFVTHKIKKHPVFSFFLIMIVTGILEYCSGYIMFLIWHKKWWDYTGFFLNIDGFVCLTSIISFAIGGLFLIYIVSPLVKKNFQTIPYRHLQLLSISLFLIYLIDNFFSFTIRN